MRQEHSSKKTSDRETDIKNVRYMATRTHFFDIRNIFSRNDIETALLRLRNKSEHNGGVPSLPWIQHLAIVPHTFNYNERIVWIRLNTNDRFN